jgi:hypothetical protein
MDDDEFRGSNLEENFDESGLPKKKKHVDEGEEGAESEVAGEGHTGEDEGEGGDYGSDDEDEEEEEEY